MVVFMVSGFWHGAAWTYVIWGALHGIYQIIGVLTLKTRNRLLEKVHLSPTTAVVTWVRRINTFILVCISWLFFRANNVGEAFTLFKVLFTEWGTGLAETLEIMGLGAVQILMCIASILVLIMIDKLLVHGDEPDGSLVLTGKGRFVYFAWIVLLCWTLLLSKDMASTFIYFQF